MPSKAYSHTSATAAISSTASSTGGQNNTCSTLVIGVTAPGPIILMRMLSASGDDAAAATGTTEPSAISTRPRGISNWATSVRTVVLLTGLPALLISAAISSTVLSPVLRSAMRYSSSVTWT